MFLIGLLFMVVTGVMYLLQQMTLLRTTSRQKNTEPPPMVSREWNYLTETYDHTANTTGLVNSTSTFSDTEVSDSMLYQLQLTLENIKKIVESKKSTRDYYWRQCTHIVQRYISQIQEVSAAV
ncbi:hypothetical protein AL387_gp113 [Salmon gill poxvirus]|uniref:Uncharacterized protein n=1 Tax=Salmon gill poxvirus TaxID=1680908 RepID=A0A0H4Y1E4_9POXV|nr:hypothetical protein AL387_gp113 [Salmon gill poxvirus]AKR04237.1 hypothetical protein SGPV113 [Salmon gill poxvirus]